MLVNRPYIEHLGKVLDINWPRLLPLHPPRPIGGGWCQPNQIVGELGGKIVSSDVRKFGSSELPSPL